MAANPTRTDDSNHPITPEESLKFAEAGMNLAGTLSPTPTSRSSCVSTHTARFLLRNAKQQECVISWVTQLLVV